MPLLKIYTEKSAAGATLPDNLEQMTLGDLISVLRAMPPDAQVRNLNYFHSSRASYDNIALEPDQGLRPASELLKEAKKACRSSFTGYKGGRFRMNKHTPIWIAWYGQCGEKLIAVLEGGIVITQEDVDNFLL
jgi:hypothetical protein